MKTPLVVLAFTALACGNGNPPPAAPPGNTPPPAATSGSMTPALRLGHYSSADGMVGFVLDRSGPTPKLRMDNESDVVPLTMRKTSQRSFDLINADKHIGLGIDDTGTIIFSKKGAGPNKEVFRDADAQPL